MLDWMVPARFVVEAVLYRDWASSQGTQGEHPGSCGIKQGLIFCLFCLLHHTPAWGGTGKETSGIHEEDHSCGIAIPAKTWEALENLPRRKNIRLLVGVCQPGFQAKGIWSSIWMFQRLSKPGQETLTPCSRRSSALWAGLSLRMFLDWNAHSSSSLPRAVAHFPWPEELLYCCPADHKL